MKRFMAAAWILSAAASMVQPATAHRPDALSRPFRNAAATSDIETVRARLAHAARIGSAGEPHILVTFRTGFCGVRLSGRMRDRYPTEMTIVLQYQFENLVVTANGFAVDLWFSGRRERLQVPFVAMTAFHEPQAGYEARFDPQGRRCGPEARFPSTITARK